MIHFIIISLIGGIIFGILDGIINANSYARKLYECYQPISKQSINIPLGFGIDLIYGFAMCGIFLMVYQSLPSDSGLVKGVIYGLIIWFFRVLMWVLSGYMMYKIPIKTLLYTAITGLIEMLIICIFFGLTIKP